MAGNVPFLPGFKGVAVGKTPCDRAGCAARASSREPGSVPAQGPSSSSSASQQCLHCLCISSKDKRHSWIQALTTTDNKTHRRHLNLAQQGHTCQCYPVRKLQPNHNKVHRIHGIWLRSALKPFLFQDNLCLDSFWLITKPVANIQWFQ